MFRLSFAAVIQSALYLTGIEGPSELNAVIQPLNLLGMICSEAPCVATSGSLGILVHHGPISHTRKPNI